MADGADNIGTNFLISLARWVFVGGQANSTSHVINEMGRRKQQHQHNHHHIVCPFAAPACLCVRIHMLICKAPISEAGAELSLSAQLAHNHLAPHISARLIRHCGPCRYARWPDGRLSSNWPDGAPAQLSQPGGPYNLLAWPPGRPLAAHKQPANTQLTCVKMICVVSSFEPSSSHRPPSDSHHPANGLPNVAPKVCERAFSSLAWPMTSLRRDGP